MTQTFQAWSLPPGSPRPSRTEITRESGGSWSLSYPCLGKEQVESLCRSLRRAREEALLGRDSLSIVRSLGRVGRRFLDPSDPLRTEALALLPDSAALSGEMAAVVLDGMARDWVPERIEEVLRAEFPEPRVLDRFVTIPPGRRVRARGWPLTLHIGAGSVPGVLVSSLIRALVVKSAALVKPGRGDTVLPVLFARGLTSEDPELGRCVAAIYWPGGASEAEGVALALADLVVVYGSDSTARAVRDRVDVSVPVVAYRHRMSFGLVGRSCLRGSDSVKTAAAAAHSVALFDQRGCVSPHAFLVEEGGETAPRDWALLLAESLSALTQKLPPGPLDLRGSSAHRQMRGSAELLAASGLGIEVWGSPALEWTVVFEPGAGLQPSCTGRFVRVVPVEDLEAVPGKLGALRSSLQSVGVAGLGDRSESLAERLMECGVSRVTSLEAMAWPPPWWHHDGRGPLNPLVRWMDLEV